MAVLVLALLFLGAECQDVPRVKTKIGIIEGTIKVSEPSSRKFSSFEGIPYAVPPIESLRFKPPVKSSVFFKPNEPLKATKLRSVCPQVTPYKIEDTEDKLKRYL